MLAFLHPYSAMHSLPPKKYAWKVCALHEHSAANPGLMDYSKPVWQIPLPP